MFVTLFLSLTAKQIITVAKEALRLAVVLIITFK